MNLEKDNDDDYPSKRFEFGVGNAIKEFIISLARDVLRLEVTIKLCSSTKDRGGTRCILYPLINY